MTVPFVTQPQRNADGSIQLGGGYDEARAAAQQQFAPQFRQQPQMQQVPLQQQIQQGLPQPQQFQQAPQQVFQPQVQPGQRFGDPNMLQHQNLQALQQQQLAQQFAQQASQQHLQSQFPGFVPQQQQAPQGLDLNVRLSGPNIPAHLQGRTVGEVIQITNGLRDMHMQFMAQQQGSPAPQQMQHQPQSQAQPQGNPNGQASDWDWRNPKAAVGAVIDEKLAQFSQRLEGMIAPAVYSSNIQGLKQARDMAAAAVGQDVFAALEPQILDSLRGSDPRALLDARVWQVAAERLVGQQALTARRQPQQMMQQQQPNRPGLYPSQVVQPGQQPLPNLSTFFAEQPNQGGPGAQGIQLTPIQLQAAAAMGMTPESYAAYYAPVATQPQFSPFGGR